MMKNTACRCADSYHFLMDAIESYRIMVARGERLPDGWKDTVKEALDEVYKYCGDVIVDAPYYDLSAAVACYEKGDKKCFIREMVNAEMDLGEVVFECAQREEEEEKRRRK